MRGFFPNLKSTFLLYGHTKISVNTVCHLMFKMKQARLSPPPLPKCPSVLELLQPTVSGKGCSQLKLNYPILCAVDDNPTVIYIGRTSQFRQRSNSF